MTKRLYFEVLTVDTLETCDVWIVRPSIDGLLQNVGLAERVGPKVMVLDIQIRSYSMLVGPRTHGELFTYEQGVRLAHHVRKNDDITIKIERRELSTHGHFRTFAVLELDDCFRYYERGAERYALGWVDLLEYTGGPWPNAK